jgi:HSP20 family protein
MNVCREWHTESTVDLNQNEKEVLNMTMLTRWEPFREMRRIHDALDRMMDETIYPGMRREEWDEGLALVDLYETDENVVVKAAMPGVEADDIDISLTGDLLNIQAEKHEEKEEEKEGDGNRRYHLREQRYKRFSRSLRMPATVDTTKAEAEFENGVLRLTLPKAEEVKPKSITIKPK